LWWDGQGAVLHLKPQDGSRSEITTVRNADLMTAKCDGCVCWIFFGPFAKNVLKGIRAVLRSRNKSLEPGATSRVSTISSGNSKSISLFTCCGWNLLVVIVKCKKSFSFISLEFSN